MFAYDSETNILSGRDVQPFYHPHVTLGQTIMHYLQREPSKVVQTCYDDGVELTAGEMAKLALRIAKNLAKAGYRLGDIVGLVSKNTTYVAPVILGCLLVGCPISTLDPSFDVGEIANIFKQTKPKLVFCDHDNLDQVAEALKRCALDSERITVDEKVEGLFRHGEGMFVGCAHEFFIYRCSSCHRVHRNRSG